jgi:hypothetical protein
MMAADLLAVLTLARRIVELHDHDNPIPQQHRPVVEVVDFRKLGKFVVEDAGIFVVAVQAEFRKPDPLTLESSIMSSVTRCALPAQ